MTAMLGLGTYRCRDTARAAEAALAEGVEWIDTAPNYHGGQDERLLSAVLRRHPHVRVSTKAGFLTSSARTASVSAGVLGSDEAAAGHCLSPAFLRWQLERSVRALGRIPEVVFLHNPEHGRPDEEWGREGLKAKMLSAFTALETACDSGLARGYGVATWSGFDSGLLAVDEIVELAEKAGGSVHRLRAVQLPLSLVHAAPLAEALDGRGALPAAQAGGLQVFASAPLHGGALPGLLTPAAVELIGHEVTAAQAALTVVASAPGVSRVLVSASSPRHWSEAAATLAVSPLPTDRLRKVLDVLAAG